MTESEARTRKAPLVETYYEDELRERLNTWKTPRFNVSNFFFTLLLINLGAIFFISADNRALKASLLACSALFVVARAIGTGSFRANFLVYAALVLTWLLFTIPAGIKNPREEFIFYFLLDFFLATSAYLVVANRQYHRTLEVFLWLYTFLLLIFCILDAIQAIEFKGAVLGGASENYTTALLIGFSLLTAGIQYKEKQRPHYLNMFFILGSSIYLESNFSALISAASILVLFFTLNLDRLKKSRKLLKGGAILIPFFLGTLLILFLDDQLGLLTPLTGDPRIIIWSDFILNAPPSAYLFGISFEQCCALIHEAFANNPHNSYIRAISFYGAGGHIFVVLLVFAIVHFIFSSRNYFYSAILLLWLLRASSDSIALPYPLDFFLFGFLSLIFLKSPNVTAEQHKPIQIESGQMDLKSN